MTRRKWAGRHRKVPIGQIKGISKHTIAKLASHTHTGRIASRVVHTVRIIIRNFLVQVCRRAIYFKGERKSLLPIHVKAGVDDLQTR